MRPPAHRLRRLPSAGTAEATNQAGGSPELAWVGSPRQRTQRRVRADRSMLTEQREGEAGSNGSSGHGSVNESCEGGRLGTGRPAPSSRLAPPAYSSDNSSGLQRLTRVPPSIDRVGFQRWADAPLRRELGAGLCDQAFQIGFRGVRPAESTKADRAIDEPSKPTNHLPAAGPPSLAPSG